MYICVCNAISESELRRAAQLCPGDAESVYATLGKQPNCRCCLDEADELLSQERECAAGTSLAA